MNSSKEMDFALAVAGKFGKSLISGGGSEHNCTLKIVTV